MNKKITALLLVLMAGLGLAQDEPLPFSMPVLEGWRTETIPFPLEFAPDLPYAGLEELRFSPGFFQADHEDFWTYAFVWWVEPGSPRDAASLSAHLETYFRGLMSAVAESRDNALGDATFAAAIEARTDGTFSGVVETFDAFVTQDQVRLNLRGTASRCPGNDREVLFFALSPKEPEHPVWQSLHAIREGFRCLEENGETSPPDSLMAQGGKGP